MIEAGPPSSTPGRAPLTLARWTPTFEALLKLQRSPPMKGNSEVVQHLNTLLANEQTAFSQYLLNSQL